MNLDSNQQLDFRRLLQSELVKRTKNNPRYSLRAFARHLEVQSGFLSNLLNGKRSLTSATIRRFGKKLGLSSQQISIYEEKNNASREHSISYQQISLDYFTMISDWYHFAILELMTVKGFQSNVLWISRKLGISAAEAQLAIDRLMRLGYIQINKKGNWSPSEGHTTTLGTKDTTEALRKMQKQILEKAITALQTVSPSLRDQSGMTMAISMSRLPQAKEKIKKFRRELCQYLEGGKTKEAVYQLSVSLYPLSQENEDFIK